MTLPTTTILPIDSERIKKGGEDLDEYMKDLIFKLQRQYEDLAQAVNGDIRSDAEQGIRKFTPTVSGLTSAGTGTYPAGEQVAWVLRQGIMVDFWFDITWESHTGTGQMLVDLPYQVATSSQKPFIGHLSATDITFTGFLNGNALPGTRQMVVNDTVSGGARVAIAITNAHTNLRGYVRYVGKSEERS